MKKNQLFAIFAVCLICAFAVASVSAEGTQIIETTGTGVVSLSPDIVHLSLSINTESPNVSDAMNENAASVQAVKDALVASGVPEEDIKTAYYSMYGSPKYDPETGTTSSTEYSYYVYYTYEVTIRDVTKLNEILDVCISNGVNNLNGIEFDSSQRQEANDQARELALDDAADKAQKIADKINVKISHVDSVKASDNSYTYDEFATSKGGSAAMVNSTGGAPVSGELSISVSVDVSYAYTLK